MTETVTVQSTFCTSQNRTSRAFQETNSRLFQFILFTARILTLTTEKIPHPFSVREIDHVNMTDVLHQITRHHLIIFHDSTSNTPLF